jgi:hypothetical protein
MKNILFKETQRFNSWYVWLIIVVCTVFSIYPIINSIQSGISFSNGQLFGLFVLVAVLLLFILLKLETEIKEEGIHVRFFPFHLKPKFYAWETIATLEIVKFSPLMDFGGWGIRWGRKGKCYTVKGNKGLQIVFKNGDRLLIGTQNPKEKERIIQEKFK